MKVEFRDDQWIIDDEKIVMNLEILPKVGEVIYFSTKLLEDNYLEMFDEGVDDDGNKLNASDFIIVNKYAGNIYKTVAATINKISHIYKETGNIVDIDITFLECSDSDKENHDDDGL